MESNAKTNCQIFMGLSLVNDSKISNPAMIAQTKLEILSMPKTASSNSV
jgi:hypothetical protein